MIKIIELSHSLEWDSIVRSFFEWDVYYLSGYVKAFHIHGDGDPYLLYYESADLRAIYVYMRRKTTIDGVEGNLYTGTESYDNLHSMLAFRRRASGKEYVIPAGEEVETASAKSYTEYYPVMFFSEQEGVSASEFVRCMQEITERYRRRKRNVVICVTAQGSEWDLALQEAFGDHYLRQDKPADEMAAEDYDALADRVFAAFEAQGAFNRVSKATQEALEGLQQGQP